MTIEKLENWYLENQRKFNFRGTTNPYYIWISEIMLQQTQAETVEPYYAKFIQRFPTIESLANANEEDIKRLVEGIGYYRRFSNLKKAAIEIMTLHNETFPTTYDALLSLSGIGKYTAGAILSIAYNQPYSALDGNVIRVLSRYLGDRGDMRKEKEKKRLDAYNQSMIEKANPRIYTQAMIELGALVCRPKNPKCSICPLNEQCFAFHNNLVTELPYLAKMKKQKVIHYIVCILEDEEHYFLRKRTENLLEGMYEWPQFERESVFSALNDLSGSGIDAELLEDMGTYQHVFSHQIWEMDVFQFRVIKNESTAYHKILKKDILKYPMAIAHRKIKTA